MTNLEAVRLVNRNKRIENIEPTVILAGQDGRPPTFLLDNGIRPVSTHVVVSAHLALAVSDQEEGVPGLGDLEIVTGLDEPPAVGHEEPLLGEDGAPFELVHGVGAVPRRGEGSHSLGAVVGLFGGFAGEPAAHGDLNDFKKYTV